MEDLLTLFDKVQQASDLPVLAKEIVLVQNPGMQHWLNMQQADIAGISMNAEFVLPAQFLWQQLRLLSGDEVPDQSPYSREVLAWRIDKLLRSDEVISNEKCQQATRYWLNNSQADLLKRFQLAVQLADLFEQYLIYRPNWINTWAQGRLVSNLPENAHQQQQWQGHIWYLLNQQIAYDPLSLITSAKQNVDNLVHLLPQRISIFGINALAPMWLDFLTILAEVIDVHFYHLNPCYEYWGEIKTDKAKAKQAYLTQIDKWPEDALVDDSVNPLLANLGQQGREFLSLLHQVPTIEIPLFDELFAEQQRSICSADKPSVLLQIQKDILTLTDKRQSPIEEVDQSITITSAHSALREVQGLHDYLLHLFNNDPSLTPKDVLVMCPQIEHYAPYIDSVFVRGWEDLGESIPPLPCSIADRISKDSEPLVAAFSELLLMPDSRFGVNQILAYLRLLPLQMRFGLTEHDIELISDWLLKANVHWGLNAQHKDQQLNTSGSSPQYTWQQGLDRLIKGFAYGDSTSIYGDDLVLPWVEGNNAVVLGKLMLLCEQLSVMTISLNRAKTYEQWQQSLQSFIEQLFIDDNNDTGLAIINQAIDSLALYCKEANYDQPIELSVIREYLNHHFSQPDPGRQFMIGQITFCSMLPMRSIPFKVLAVLGLNDGDFPRQRQPLGFDLMAMTNACAGDRSRRGDDRYLFLEAIISARDKLYLSFQGHDIKNNNQRQPSIVLREFMDYLSHGYGWQFKTADKTHENQLRQLPLQVFSVDNYSGSNDFKSFDKKWLELARITAHSKELAVTDQQLPSAEEPLLELSLEQLNRFLAHPSQVFAQQRLKLFFSNNDVILDDAEPFAFNHLDKYLFQQQVLNESLQPAKEQTSTSVNAVALLSGDFPDNPLFAEQLDTWQANIENFSQAVRSQIQQRTGLIASSAELQCYQIKLRQSDEQILVSADLNIYRNDQQVWQFNYRPASVKGKDLSLLYLQHLLLCAAHNDTKQVSSIGFFINEKNNSLQIASFDFIHDAKQQLEKLFSYYKLGLSKPLLLNCAIAKNIFWQTGKTNGKYIDSDFSQAKFAKLWFGDFNQPGLENDPYISYFWPDCPEFNDISANFADVYRNLYQRLTITEQDLMASTVSAVDSSMRTE